MVKKHRKVLIRSFSQISKGIIEKYKSKIIDEIIDKGYDGDKNRLIKNDKFSDLEQEIERDPDMSMKYLDKYINEVLLKNKYLIDLKISYSESNWFMIGSSEGFIAIIYEEK